jgi:hypothetical protein
MRYFTYAVTTDGEKEIAQDTSRNTAEYHANVLSRVVNEDVRQIIIRDAKKNLGDIVLTLTRKIGIDGPYWSNSNW